jgi:hexosaminidase
MIKDSAWIAAALTVLFAIGCLCARAEGADTNAPPEAAKASLPVLPTPKSVQLEGGEMPLTAGSRIVAADTKLKPIAEILAREIWITTGLKLATAGGNGKPGDIVLKINPKLRADDEILAVENQKIVKTRDFAHAITVADMAVVEGWDYRAVCEGTATILQAIVEKDGKCALPRMTVKDWPHADYQAIMVDCGRQEIPIYVLQKMVEKCRYYKVRYCHLHLSDDHGYTFPLKKYPRMGEHNRGHCEGDAPRIYDLKELKDLVAFADARGVTLVPELETPGHSDAIRLDLPDELDRPKEMGGGARLAMMNIADDKIYPTLDYIVGEICDVFKSSPYFHIGCDEVNSTPLMGQPWVGPFLEKNGLKDGYNDLIKRHIRKMNEIVRKRGKMPIIWSGPPMDPAMKDEVIVMTWYDDGSSAEAFANGFATITTPWGLGVPFNEWSLYNCNGTVLDRSKNRVLGANMPHWEMSAQCLNGAGSFPRQERTWGPDNRITEPEFTERQTPLIARLAKLVEPVTIRAEGNILKEEGWMRTRKEFAGPLTISLSTSNALGRIRYTLDNTEPTAKSALYEKPFQVSRTVRLRTALFDGAGAMLGHVCLAKFVYVQEQNLTTGKPVTTSTPHEGTDKPQNAVDGTVKLETFWGASPAPQWLQVDLEKALTLDRIHIFPYWDGARCYQYTIELSTDGSQWTQVVDASQNTRPATWDGTEYKFKPTAGRYIRVNMLKNSDNPAVHLVEIWAYEEGK